MPTRVLYSSSSTSARSVELRLELRKRCADVRCGPARVRFLFSQLAYVVVVLHDGAVLRCVALRLVAQLSDPCAVGLLRALHCGARLMQTRRHATVVFAGITWFAIWTRLCARHKFGDLIAQLALARRRSLGTRACRRRGFTVALCYVLTREAVEC